jgi:hypothetical protein
MQIRPLWKLKQSCATFVVAFEKLRRAIRCDTQIVIPFDYVLDMQSVRRFQSHDLWMLIGLSFHVLQPHPLLTNIRPRLIGAVSVILTSPSMRCAFMSHHTTHHHTTPPETTVSFPMFRREVVIFVLRGKLALTLPLMLPSFLRAFAKFSKSDC